jgi:hypothetical protein
MRTAGSLCLSHICLWSVVIASLDANDKAHPWRIRDGAPKELQVVIDSQSDTAFVREAIRIEDYQLTQARKNLANLKRKRPIDQDAVRETERRIEELTARARGLKNGTALAWPRYSTDKISVGTAGIWNAASTFKVDDVIDEKNLVLELQDTGLPQIWVRGMDTNGIVDGKEIYHDRLMLVYVGTIKHRGSTIFLAHPFSAEDFVYTGDDEKKK